MEISPATDFFQVPAVENGKNPPKNGASLKTTFGLTASGLGGFLG